MRNADLREALVLEYPATTFSLRNGAHGAARVSWTDGPPEHAVEALLRSVPADLVDPGDHWAVELRRSATPQFIAAAYVRAQALGVDFYGENEDGGRTGARWALVWERLDAGDVTSDQRRAADVLLAMTSAASVPQIAAAVFRHGAAVAAALT